MARVREPDAAADVPVSIQLRLTSPKSSGRGVTEICTCDAVALRSSQFHRVTFHSSGLAAESFNDHKIICCCDNRYSYSRITVEPGLNEPGGMRVVSVPRQQPSKLCEHAARLCCRNDKSNELTNLLTVIVLVMNDDRINHQPTSDS